MRRRIRPRALVLATFSLALGACGSDDSADSTTTTVSSTTTAPATSTSTTSTTEPEVPVTPPGTSPGTSPATSVDIAIADLAERLGIAPADIEVVSVDEVTWPNGALGCPEPGMNYTQALVNGQRIILAADGAQHAYHSGRSGTPFFCPPERITPPTSGNA